MKVVRYNSLLNERKIVEYPNKDKYSPIVGLSDNIKYYIVKNITEPEYDSMNQKLVYSEEYSDEVHPDYPYIYLIIGSYTIENKSNNIIISQLNESVGNWIEEYYPLWKQTKYISQYLQYQWMLNNSYELTETQLLDLEYINKIRQWGDNCRLERDNKESELLINGVLPNYAWETPPTKNI